MGEHRVRVPHDGSSRLEVGVLPENLLVLLLNTKEFPVVGILRNTPCPFALNDDRLKGFCGRGQANHWDQVGKAEVGTRYLSFGRAKEEFILAIFLGEVLQTIFNAHVKASLARIVPRAGENVAEFRLGQIRRLEACAPST